MESISVGSYLRSYERRAIAPLVEAAGYAPIIEDVLLPTFPGTLMFLMNNANDFAFASDLVFWYPLSVLYQDSGGNTGTVYSIKASFNPRNSHCQIERAEIHNVAAFVREEDHVAWEDAYSGSIFIRYPLHEADKVLMNSWYLFRGAVIPMLEREMYQFPQQHEKFAFQQTMIRTIHKLYDEAV